MSWYEIWSDESFELPYLLILKRQKGKFIVIDPRENNTIIFESSCYGKAKSWLIEDEYLLVTGRMQEDI